MPSSCALFRHCITPTRVVAGLISMTGVAHADCIDQAAAHHGVNPLVLRAIGWQESRLRPEALGRNTNGTLDIGAFQINSLHLPKLARYGVSPQALTDGCVSAYVGAWHYRQQTQEFGNTWYAVGAYHSRTPARAAWYANQIAQQLMRWQVMPKGPLPYAKHDTLQPSTNTVPANPAPPRPNGLSFFDAPARRQAAR